jgi:NitT/TauT family transport system permease protein
MHWKAKAIQFGCVAGVIAIWQLGSVTGLVDPLLLPAPGKVVDSLVELGEDRTFIANSATTFFRIVIAFGAAAPIAILAGCIIAEMKSQVLRRYITLPLGFAMAIPKSIFLPLFVLALGLGDLQKVVFAATYFVFALCIGTISAIESVPAGHVVAARSFGATRLQIATRVYMPFVLPAFIGNLRMALCFTLSGVLVAEMYASQLGIGKLLIQWSDSFLVSKMMAAILLVSLFAIFINESMRAIERRLGRWRVAALVE